jgi:hypothetical protein
VVFVTCNKRSLSLPQCRRVPVYLAAQHETTEAHCAGQILTVFCISCRAGARVDVTHASTSAAATGSTSQHSTSQLPAVPHCAPEAGGSLRLESAAGCSPVASPCARDEVGFSFHTVPGSPKSLNPVIMSRMAEIRYLFSWYGVQQSVAAPELSLAVSLPLQVGPTVTDSGRYLLLPKWALDEQAAPLQHLTILVLVG